MADHIPQLVQGMRSSQAQPEELSAQLALIMASQSFLQPGSKMVTSAKSTVPTVTDQAAAMQLGQCAKNLATCLAELRTATQKVSSVPRGVAHTLTAPARQRLGDLGAPNHPTTKKSILFIFHVGVVVPPEFGLPR